MSEFFDYAVYKNNLFVDDKNVVRDTSIGRKRKLSLYRTKRRKVEVRDTDNLQSKPNFVRLQKEAKDANVNILDTTSEESDGSVNLNTSINSISDSNNSGSVNADGNTQEGGDQSYLENCLTDLKQSDTLDKVLGVLHQSGQLYDFMNLLELISSERLPTDNIVLLLLFERVKFEMCDTTVGMRYSETTKVFWSIVYRLCKGNGLKFFCGEKNWGQVVRKQCARSKYSPNTSKINFAVPDEKILRDFNKSLPKIIPPGKIESSMKLVSGKTDLVLMGDGKLVTKGLSSSFNGDINLFGHEVGPNLEELKDDLRMKLEFVSKAAINYSDSCDSDKFEILDDLLKVISNMNTSIREYHMSEKKKLRNYELQMVNATVKFPDRAISKCKTNMYTAAMWMKRSMKLNGNICSLMSKLLHNSHLFTSDCEAELTDLQNLRLLHTVQYITGEITAVESPHLVKKYTDVWEDLKLECYLTSQSAYDAIGLNGIKAMRTHYKQFVTQEIACEDRNYAGESIVEIDGIATIATSFMPALLPSCSVLYEEGCRYILGHNKRKLLSCSIAGHIR